MKKILTIIIALLPLAAMAQQQTFRWGLQIGWHGGVYQCSNQELSGSQNSIYDFGAQFRIGGRLYGATGLNCHVANQSFSRGDSSCDLKQDYIGIPLRIGFQPVSRKDWNWNIETGLEYRGSVFISPNDWGLDRDSRELNRHHLDFVAGTGADWGRLNVTCPTGASSAVLYATPAKATTSSGFQSDFSSNKAQNRTTDN